MLQVDEDHLIFFYRFYWDSSSYKKWGLFNLIGYLKLEGYFL